MTDVSVKARPHRVGDFIWWSSHARGGRPRLGRFDLRVRILTLYIWYGGSLDRAQCEFTCGCRLALDAPSGAVVWIEHCGCRSHERWALAYPGARL